MESRPTSPVQASSPTRQPSPSSTKNLPIRRAQSTGLDGAGRASPQVAPHDAASQPLQISRKPNAAFEKALTPDEGIADLAERIANKMPVPVDESGRTLSFREFIAPPSYFETLALVDEHMRDRVLEGFPTDGQINSFKALGNPCANACAALQRFVKETTSTGASIEKAVKKARKEEQETNKKTRADCSATTRAFEIFPQRLSAGITRQVELMGAIAKLSVNRRTRGALLALIENAVAAQHGLSFFSIMTEGSQFYEDLGGKVEILHDAMRAGDDLRIEISRRVLAAYKRDKWEGGVRQTFAKLRSYLTSIEWIEHPLLASCPVVMQRNLKERSLLHYSGAVEAICELVVHMPIGISDSIESHRRHLARQAAGPGGSLVADQPSQTDLGVPASAAQHLLSELAIIEADWSELFPTLAWLMRIDRGNCLSDTSGSSTSKRHMETWRDYMRDTSRAYGDLQAIWRSHGFDEKATAPVIDALQRWEDAFGLAAKLLDRYATLFCEHRAEDLAAGWLGDHLKRLEDRRPASIVDRRGRTAGYKLKTVSTQPAEIEVKAPPPMTQHEIRTAFEAIHDGLRPVDWNYLTGEGYASLFDHMSNYTRSSLVRSMRSQYHWALRDLDRLAEQPELPRELLALLEATREKCRDRGETLAVVQDSDRIRVPIEDDMAPRWRSGVARCEEPSDGALVTLPWTDPGSGKARFEQYISLHFHEQPITVVREGRSLEPFPVAHTVMHIHLDTTEKTKIGSLDEFRPELVRWVRIKIPRFDMPNKLIRKRLGIKQGLGTDGSKAFACEVMAHVLAAKESTPAPV